MPRLQIGPFDYSHKVTVTHSIELPFWIPIKSGDYRLPNHKMVKIRNDLWLVSIANVVDGFEDEPHEIVVDETQVSDREYLEKITEGRARYFHKRKMKTTFDFNLALIPPEGLFSAEPGSEDWKEQIQEAVSNTSFPDWILDDINRFIDYYCSLISVSHQAREVRRVSSYETMARLLVNVEIDELQYTYPTTFFSDINMVELPFPLFCIFDNQKLVMLQNSLESLEEPSFHQLQWIKTLNYIREERYQEALLSATLALEALAYSYLSVKGYPEKQIYTSGGMANWVKGIACAFSKYIKQVDSSLDYVDSRAKSMCNSVARMWFLRNKVVHNQKILTRVDFRDIRDGIESLGNLRSYFLNEINPNLLQLELQFESILDPVPIRREPIDPFGQRFTVKYEWRKELDCYENPESLDTEDNVKSDERS